MGKGGSSTSSQSTSNYTTVNTTTSIKNDIDTQPIADSIAYSNELISNTFKNSSALLSDVLSDGNKIFTNAMQNSSESSNKSISSLNNTLLNLVSSNNADNKQTAEVLKIGSVLLGVGVIYYIGKNKIKKGKK